MKRAERPMDYAAVRYRNRIAAAAAVLSALAVLSACGSSSGGDNADKAVKPSPETSSSSETETPSTAAPDPEDAEKKAVTDAYADMWDEQVKAYAKADVKGTDLSTYSAAKAWVQTKRDLEALKSKGMVATGKPEHDVKVTGFKPDKQVPWAGLTDCLDTANWKYVYRKSGKAVPIPDGRLESYTLKVQAEKWGKQWKIVDLVPQDRAC